MPTRNSNVSNVFQSILLILAMSVLAGFVGFLLGGKFGLYAAAGLTVFGLVAGQRASAALVLRMYKAQPIPERQTPELYGIYNELCRRAELSPFPKLYYIPSRMPNAFAVGSGDSSSIAVTDGLLRMMNPRELAGILAHEITHVQSCDTSVLGVADIISRTISVMSRLGLFMMLFSFPMMQSKTGYQFWLTGMVLFFSPTIAMMLQLALSRTREFNADRGAAELTGDAHGLASALRKLERQIQGGVLQRILRPGMRRQQPAMLRTHPPTEDRIDALMEIAESLQKSNSIRDSIDESRRRIESNQPRVKTRPRYHVISGLWR